MVAETYRDSEKGKVQGFHDFVLFGTVAFASLMSGKVYNAWGWEMLNWVIFPVVLLCFAALGALALRVGGWRHRPGPGAPCRSRRAAILRVEFAFFSPVRLPLNRLGKPTTPNSGRKTG